MLVNGGLTPYRPPPLTKTMMLDKGQKRPSRAPKYRFPTYRSGPESNGVLFSHHTKRGEAIFSSICSIFLQRNDLSIVTLIFDQKRRFHVKDNIRYCCLPWMQGTWYRYICALFVVCDRGIQVVSLYYWQGERSVRSTIPQ